MSEVRSATSGMGRIRAAATSLEAVLPGLMPDLLRYFVRRLEDREDAADALAETLLVLWRRERHLPGDAEGIRRYAFGVAARVLGTAVRGRMRRTALADRLRAGLVSDPSIQVEDSTTPVDGSLREALASLSAKDRELVLLVAWDGFGVAEAGAVLGMRADAARQRWSRARARLRERLTD